MENSRRVTGFEMGMGNFYLSFRIGCSLVLGCEKGSGLVLGEHKIKLRYLGFIFKK